MTYLELEGDQYDALLRVADSQAPRRSARRVSWLGTDVIPVGASMLAVDRTLGSWALLSRRELEVARSLDGGDSRRSGRGLGPRSAARQARFVRALYRRGLVALDGERFVPEDVYRRGPLALSTPLFLVVPTERCNLSCRYCFADSTPATRDIMGGPTARRVLALVERYGAAHATLEFAGGEPFLARSLVFSMAERAARAARARGARLDLVVQTNATALTADVVERIGSLGMSVGVSLDGAPALHDVQRPLASGGPSYGAVLRGLLHLVQAKVRFAALAVLTRHGVAAEPLGPLRHLEELGLTKAKVNPVFPQGRAGARWDELALAPEEYLAFQRRYLRALASGEVRIAEENTAHALRKLATRLHLYRCTRSRCGAGRDFFCFGPDGRVHPCSRFRGRDELSLGAVHDLDDLRGAADRNQTLRRTEARDVAAIPACRECAWARFCEAGCPLDAYAATGESQSPHPNCAAHAGLFVALFEELERDPRFARRLCPDVRVRRVEPLA